jgi:UDP:flavonoid glycosyltransferase YjiC (YdhE family)
MSPRVLFATTAGVGHFSPLVPFAHACTRAGHDVLVVGHAGAAGVAQRAGLPFRAVPEPSDEELARFRAGQEGLPGMEAMARAVTELYVRMYAATALDGMLEAIEQWRPDVVVREGAEFSSLVGAERHGIPHVEVGVGLSIQTDLLLPLAAPALDELGAKVGVPAGLADRMASALCMTLAPPSLEDPIAPQRQNVRRFRNQRRPAGPLHLDWGDPAAPLVYLSFGTEVPSPSRDYFPSLYRAALGELADLPVRVLATIGERRHPAELGALAPSVRVERWIAQADVMPHAAAMVGHGGAGSTLTALAAGVPMALVPLFADQPLNARRVADLGVGIALDRGADSVGELGAAVEALLTDASFRERAMELADEIQALAPVDEAAQILAAIARESQIAATA